MVNIKCILPTFFQKVFFYNLVIRDQTLYCVPSLGYLMSLLPKRCCSFASFTEEIEMRMIQAQVQSKPVRPPRAPTLSPHPCLPGRTLVITSPAPCSLSTGTAGIYQGANGLTNAAGFGSVHQVDGVPAVAFSPLSLEVPLEKSTPRAPRHA